MPTAAHQTFAIAENAPGLLEGIAASHAMGARLRAQTSSAGPNDHSAFETAMLAQGVGSMNFRRWVTDDYIIPAIEFAWRGWQGARA